MPNVPARSASYLPPPGDPHCQKRALPVSRHLSRLADPKVLVRLGQRLHRR